MTETNKTDDIIMLLKKLILNTEQSKQTPYDIKIKSRIKEPKIVEDMRFTPKQKYRKYKTKIEPNLLNKVMIDEEDDVVAKLKEEFDSKNKQKQMELIKTTEVPNYKQSEIKKKNINRLRSAPEIRKEDIDRLRRAVQEKVDLVGEFSDVTPGATQALLGLTQMKPTSPRGSRIILMRTPEQMKRFEETQRKLLNQFETEIKEIRDNKNKNKSATTIQNAIRGHNARKEMDILYDDKQSALSTAVAASPEEPKRGRGRPKGSFGQKRKLNIAAENAASKIKQAKKINNPTGPFSFKNAYAESSLLGYY